jgi:pimeloyl-ACP methyl ester carboxylesterase
MRPLAVAALGLLVVVGGAAALGPLAISLREPDDGHVLPPGVAGRLLDVGGRRVHVVERGAGPPLVLIHGFGGSTYDFEESVVEPLSRRHRVIAIDLYGFGWSERSGDFAYGWPLWSDQVAGTLDALGIERAAVLGHSMGGAVAAVFAARHPDRIDRLILADALYPQEPDEVPLAFRALRAPVLGELALGLVADGSAPGFSTAHAERARAWYRIRGTRDAMLRYVRDPGKMAALAAAYPAIAAPTLVLHGSVDPFVSYASMERAVPAIRHARVVPLAGGGHFPFRDDADAFVRETEVFLGELLAAGERR